MKYLKYIFMGALGGLFMFFAGFFIRQPEINQLKNQIKVLQEDNSRLYKLRKIYQDRFTELYVQLHKLKIFHLIQRAKIKDQAKESLIMQYAVKEYVELLEKRFSKKIDLTKEEIKFFQSFTKLVDDKKMDDNDMETIKGYVVSKYFHQIEKLEPCKDIETFEKFSKIKV